MVSNFMRTLHRVGESSPESGWSELEMNSDTMILPKIFDEDGKRRPPKFPRRQKRPGKASGFTIAVNPKLDSYYCANLDSAGFMVRIIYLKTCYMKRGNVLELM